MLIIVSGIDNQATGTHSLSMDSNDLVKIVEWIDAELKRYRMRLIDAVKSGEYGTVDSSIRFRAGVPVKVRKTNEVTEEVIL